MGNSGGSLSRPPRKSLWRRIARHKNTVIVAAMRLLTHVSLALVFFGLMAINNFALLHPSRTLATTVLTYVAMSGVMHSVYGGYAVGKKKSRPVISSMSLAVIGTDLVTYLQLQIMNVNPNNNVRLEIFGRDFLPLLLAMVLQVVLVILLVRGGNMLFFKLHPPKECLLIMGQIGEEGPLRAKLGRYKLQWRISQTAYWYEKDVKEKIDRAQVVFLGGVPEREKITLMQECYDRQKDVFCRAQLQDIMLSNAKQLVIDDAPFLEMEYRKITIGQRILKRGMDVGISAIALLILSPLLAVIAMAIRMEDGKSVFFRQERLTVNGRVFTILKFRTMKHQDTPCPQASATQADERITRVGSILRKYRMDELPQLINIFRGDMTLVGPRPEMLDNVARYKSALPAFIYREKMKAGLTGYAQIEGRYNTTPEDKLMLDLMYIESFSIWLDIKLLFRTLTVFFKPDSTEAFRRETMQSKAQAGEKSGDQSGVVESGVNH